MSSSDSDDDCYGNIAQKLQSIKSTYDKEKVTNAILKDSSENVKSSDTAAKSVEESSEIIVEDCNVTASSIDNDEFSLDAIIANNSKTRSKRGRPAKRKSSEDTSVARRGSKRKTKNSTSGRSSPVAETVAETPSVDQNTSTTSTSRGRGNSTRSRAATRGRQSRGRGRRGNSSRGHAQHRREDLFAIFSRHGITIPSNQDYPIYSVGNTDEYPDQCDNQELFATRTVNNDVEVVETDPLEEENEEMSVKVYWQNLEIFKFKIRKYQKLTQIFDYFTEKEGVSNDKLLFTYNDRILKMDDTPDSINYSIAKFIDGGIVNQNVTELTKENESEVVNNGLKIKFQCQNKKKPFETMIQAQDKLMLAMMKCAEHLETPLERLKFYFDGDLISSKNTPRDLELEGGECIDVKICS